MATFPRMQACPDSPNCVFSLAKDSRHKIAPFKFKNNPKESMTKLVTILKTVPRTKIVTQEADYLHVTFTSAILRFVDDVEFQVDRTAGVLNVRSASRTGYSDFGVNRKRVEELRALYSKS